MGEQLSCAIWWIRRDLRLKDNEALTAALAHANTVIPVFIFDPALLSSPYVGEKRLAFLLEGLHSLDTGLRKRGSRLVIRHGRPAAELATLLEESNATRIFAEEDYSNYARQRDEKIAASLPLQLVGTSAIRPPGTVMKGDGDPYIVYTPFSRVWKSLSTLRQEDVLPAPDRLASPGDLKSEPIPDELAQSDGVPFTTGEAEAQRRLQAFTGGDSPPIYAYASHRNRMDLAGTSQLSPYLRLGMLSPREAAVAALATIAEAPHKNGRKGAQTWLNELIWRDFYIHILYHFPHVATESFRENYRHIPWRDDEEALAAWRNGRTGYPIVDAAMRQLRQSGWVHNRARMLAASFLTKDLLINWREGERWFMQHLVDGDPAANNGGWQWVAGTGTDAAPYFRIFNPITQSKKFDPDGHYIRQWVPELASVPGKYIHTPWKMPAGVQRESNVTIGRTYPAPIVDHKEARQRTLEAYGQSKEQAEG